MSCITTTCPTNPALFAHDNKCITECPAGMYSNSVTRTCENTCTGIYLMDDSTRRCVTICPTNPNLFADWTTNACVSECPATYFSDNSTR